MKKSILFINQSSGYLMIDIVHAHLPYYEEVVLLTGFLNPRETPLHEKVIVKKCVTYQRHSALKRITTWLGFWVQTLYYVFIKYNNHQVYFVSNPPLNIFTASWIKRDFAFLIYDIYPQALAKHNIIKKDAWLYKHWEKTNQKVYAKAKNIYTLSEGMKSAMNIPNQLLHKVKVVPVWTNNTFFKDIPLAENEFIKKYDLQDKFIVSYSGNLGKTHPVEKLVELAKLLVEEKEICFLIIGEGDKKAQLLQTQKEEALPNLKIFDFQPTALFPHVLAAASIGVVTLEADAADLSVPSKTYNLMSAGKPILSIAKNESELAQIITTNEIGQNFTEEELEKMSGFITHLKNNPTYYHQLKENSKKASLKFSPENAKQMILI